MMNIPKMALYIPKGEDPNINGATLSFFYYFGEYVYNLTAKPASGHVFSNWTVTDSKITGNFKTNSITITFTALSGTSKTGSNTYSIDPNNNTVKITYTDFAKSGAHKTCSFTFRESGKSSDTTVTFTVTQKNKYIKNAKVGTAEYYRDNYVVGYEISFSVVLADMQWNTEFN